MKTIVRNIRIAHPKLDEFSYETGLYVPKIAMDNKPRNYEVGARNVYWAENTPIERRIIWGDVYVNRFEEICSLVWRPKLVNLFRKIKDERIKKYNEIIVRDLMLNHPWKGFSGFIDDLTKKLLRQNVEMDAKDAEFFFMKLFEHYQGFKCSR